MEPGINVTAMAAARYYSRPVVFVRIHDLEPCHVALAWWPEDTASVADLVTVATRIANISPGPAHRPHRLRVDPARGGPGLLGRRGALGGRSPRYGRHGGGR